MKLKGYRRKKSLWSIVSILLVLMGLIVLQSCNDNIAVPPRIKVMVNGNDITESPLLKATAGTRFEYSFEITADVPIDNLKTIIFDVSVPTKKIAKEQLVGGQTSSTSEVVKGVFFLNYDTEIKLVVKDLDGNEVAKSFTVIVE